MSVAHAAVAAVLGSTDLRGGQSHKVAPQAEGVFSFPALLSFPSLPLRLSLSEGDEKVNDLQRPQSADGRRGGGHGRAGSPPGIHRKCGTSRGRSALSACCMPSTELSVLLNRLCSPHRALRGNSCSHCANRKTGAQRGTQRRLEPGESVFGALLCSLPQSWRKNISEQPPGFHLARRRQRVPRGGGQKGPGEPWTANLATVLR